jgi:hypothetical protein
MANKILGCLFVSLLLVLQLKVPTKIRVEIVAINSDFIAFIVISL